MISSSSPTSRRPHYYIIPAPWLCSRCHLTNKSIVSRVQTELESFPATLFNILLADSPNWFTEAMTCRVRYHIWKIADLPKRLEEVIAIECGEGVVTDGDAGDYQIGTDDSMRGAL